MYQLIEAIEKPVRGMFVASPRKLLFLTGILMFLTSLFMSSFNIYLCSLFYSENYYRLDHFVAYYICYTYSEYIYFFALPYVVLSGLIFLV